MQQCHQVEMPSTTALFSHGLIDCNFFNTYPTRHANATDNVLTNRNDSLLHFDIGFLMSDLTEQSIFYNTNISIRVFTFYTNDLASHNYVDFPETVSILSQLSSDSNGTNLVTNATTCHSLIAIDLAFCLNDIEVEYNCNYDYIIVAQRGQHIMSAYLHLCANDTSFDIELTSIYTEINDVSLHETEVDDSNDEME